MSNSNNIDNDYIIQHLKEWLMEKTTTKIKMLTFNKNYNKIKEYIINITSFYNNISLSDRVYCIINDIIKPKKCSCGCGQILKNIKNNYIRGHCNTCESIKLKKKNSYKSKTGYDNPSQNPDIKLKKKETCLERYGASNHMMLDEFKSKVSLSNRITQNLLPTKEKIKQTNLKKYGDINYARTEEYKYKVKQTNLEKYGKEWYTQTNVHHEKTALSYKNKNEDEINNIKSKKKQTNLEKYGKEWYSETEEYKNKFKCYKKVILNEDYDEIDYKEYQKVKQMLEKNNITKTKNNSFNNSIQENNIFEKLKSKFPDVNKQYSSDEYPYLCDFYIPCLDLYIEYQGIWIHNNHPFDYNNEEDILILKEWEAKSASSKFYKNAINVWTVTDPMKRKIAKENKLNWIEFFNMDQFNKWFDGLNI